MKQCRTILVSLMLILAVISIQAQQRQQLSQQQQQQQPEQEVQFISFAQLLEDAKARKIQESSIINIPTRCPGKMIKINNRCRRVFS
ncbi:hypothetical protein TKK_0018883 [Trichogramma kaykai]|uniref:Uncharacterized protein n=1 Tax=Trichogramma kaykai TaxID=54128 RepID=A0ABD2VW10_9HYME